MDDARDVSPTTADDEHEVRAAATHVRRYAKPKILEEPGDDGLRRAIFDGPHATTEPLVMCGGARRIGPPAPESARASAPPAGKKTPTAYEAPQILETEENKARREFWKECVANSKNPEYQSALNESRATAEEERKKRRTQLAEFTQGTAWKVLDLAKLEPPRRDGSRALNVAALLEDFRRLGKSSGLPFCIRFALEAALLKNEPMKNEVTCYNAVRTFSTKVVPKVAD